MAHRTTTTQDRLYMDMDGMESEVTAPGMSQTNRAKEQLDEAHG